MVIMLEHQRNSTFNYYFHEQIHLVGKEKLSKLQFRGNKSLYKIQVFF